jgi:DNA repair exonuclease SbcCD ATPase subunit
MATSNPPPCCSCWRTPYACDCACHVHDHCRAGITALQAQNDELRELNVAGSRLGSWQALLEENDALKEANKQSIEIIERQAQCIQDKETIAAENAALRSELENQWEYNHSEHCANNWPHEGDCHWPRPAILDSPCERAMTPEVKALREQVERLEGQANAFENQLEGRIKNLFGGMDSGSPVWGATQYDKGWTAGIQATLGELRAEIQRRRQG